MHTDNTKRAKYLSLTTLSNELCHTFFSNRRPSSRHSKRLERIENRIEIIEIEKDMSMNRIEKNWMSSPALPHTIIAPSPQGLKDEG